MPGIGQVVARHTRTRTPDGGVTWACMFTVVADGASDLAVVHRLSAPTLAEARRKGRGGSRIGVAAAAGGATLRVASFLFNLCMLLINGRSREDQVPPRATDLVDPEEHPEVARRGCGDLGFSR